MAYDDKITHSFICEHTRQVAVHDRFKKALNRKKAWHMLSSAIRSKEFNRSRHMLLTNALRRRRMAKVFREDSKE
jgi:hypothetical protein